MSTNSDVGYGKPPKSNQFKPGTSGNPAGRPKGVKNLVSYLDKVLQEEVLVTEGGKTVKVTKLEAMVKSLVAKGLSGDIRSLNTLMKLYQDHEKKVPTLHNFMPGDPNTDIIDIDKVLEGLGGKNGPAN